MSDTYAKKPSATATEPAPTVRETWRWLELVVAFLGLPIAVGLFVPPPFWIPSLWLVALAVFWLMARDTHTIPTGFWARIDWQKSTPTLRRIAVRFAVSAIALLIAMMLWAPTRLFDILRSQPRLWITIMILYPIFSVYAQELLYRRYLFHRLRTLRLSTTQMVWVSAVLFAAMHLIFRNQIAVALTLIGGWFFADTYRRTGSLRLVCLEHALYGNLIFTIGLGEFFFHEAMQV